MSKFNHFYENPFFILKASSSDNRQKIVQLAQDMSLDDNHENCNKARSDLNSPRARIAAEIGWLLGEKTFDSVKDLIEKSINNPFSLQASQGNALDQANLMAAALQNISGGSVNKISKLIFQLGLAIDAIKISDVVSSINNCRKESGFSDVASSHVEEHLVARKLLFKHIARDAIDKMPSNMVVLAMTNLMKDAAEFVPKHKHPSLISWLVDIYEKEAAGFIEQQEKIMTLLATKVGQASISYENKDNKDLHLLQGAVKKWQTVMDPIYIGSELSGIQKQYGMRTVIAINNAVIDMWNVKNMSVKWHCDEMMEMAQQLASRSPNMLETVNQSKSNLNKAAATFVRPNIFEWFLAKLFKLAVFLLVRGAALFVGILILAAIKAWLHRL